MDMHHLLNEAEFWVAVGLVLFLLIVVLVKAPGLAARNLDARSDKIRTALAEAEALREDARRQLAELTARRAELEGQASRMLSDAQAEAERLEADAKTKLEEQIRRRTELADRRIALAETQATAEVKAAAVDLAVKAAEQVLARRTAAIGADPLVDRAVAELGTRLQ